jgi:hypothetical protein
VSQAARLEALAQQRAALSAEIAEHRVQIARAAQRLHGPLRRVDRLREEVHVLREHYAWLLLPVAVLALLNPVRTLKVVAGALGVWRTFNQARLPPPGRG